MSTLPAVDYTDKDFGALRRAMLALARLRLPEWTDRSPADLGMLLVDLFALVGDVVLYYQDRIASEGFLETAVERRSVIQLLRLVGYELAPPASASAELALTFKAPPPGASAVVVPAGAQFSTPGTAAVPAQTFEYAGPDLAIDLASDQVEVTPAGKRIFSPLPVRHATRVPTEILGSSSGEPDQSFAQSRSPVLLDSLVVQVEEGAGWVTWDRRESLLFGVSADGRVEVSRPDARDYVVQLDENDVARVRFGDGTFGRPPPRGVKNVRAEYRVGGGSVGNVPAGSITKVGPAAVLPAQTRALLDSVTNPLPAAGGADHEDAAHAVRFGPLAFRSGDRAVTLSDHVTLAYRAGGVAKVRARSRAWNRIELFVAPEGDAFRPAPEALRRRLLAWFEDRRMLATEIEIRDPIAVPVDVSVQVLVDAHHPAGAVLAAVEAAVNDLLSYANVDFGKVLYLSDVYARVEAVAGVAAATVVRFRRRDGAAAALEAQIASGALPGLEALPADVRARVLQDAATEGRVEMGEFELPVPGTLEVGAIEGAA